MRDDMLIRLDVAVIGGGPAGISACLELSKSSKLNIALFEMDRELGGVPRACHLGFGMRDLKRFYNGQTYARKLDALIHKKDIRIYTESTVTNIIPDLSGRSHRIEVLNRQGLMFYESRFVVLATGCCESSRGARCIPGTRPAGIYTTGELQQLVNLHHLKPGKNAIVVGSENVAFSSILTLNRAGAKIVCMVEEDAELKTYSYAAKMMSLFYRFPIYKNTFVNSVLGEQRVEGVELITKGIEKRFRVECDSVIVTGKFRPITMLIDDSDIEQDGSARGPAVDTNLMTSVPGIFAAGNLLRGADMNDLCGLEGRHAARGILKMMESSKPEDAHPISLRAEPPIRYVVPQRVFPNRPYSSLWSWMCPGVSIQLEHTIKRPVIEAWSGEEKIWTCSFAKIYANTRTSVPVRKFEWNRVDPGKGIVLRIQA
jgi:thioredoxin reductase